MSQRNTVKSYCKMASVLPRRHTDLDFRDTNGILINCNWFSVDCSATAGDRFGFYVVQPSGVYNQTASAGAQIAAGTGEGSVEIQNLSSTTGQKTKTASGIGGMVGVAGRDPVEMNLSTNDKTTGIRIWNYTEAHPHALFIVNYGNVKHANAWRDNDNDIWPAGQ